MMIWRFRRLIAAYGAEPSRWPPGRRPPAEALLARSEEARTLLADAQALDSLLMADAMEPVDEQLASVIVARATATPQEGVPAPGHAFTLDWSPRLWPHVVGLAVAAVIGFIVGWTDLLPAGSGGDTIDLADILDTGINDGGPLL